MVFVQSRIAMLDIYALAFDLFGVAAFIYGYLGEAKAGTVAFALVGTRFRPGGGACKWSGVFPLGVCDCNRRS